MTLDARIILGGKAPDIMGAMQQGNALARDHLDMRRQSELQRLYRDQGAGIAAGEDAAVNALAGLDPMAALGVRRDHQNMGIAQRNERRADAQLQLQRDQFARQSQVQERTLANQDREWQLRVQEHAATLSAQEREAQAQQVEQAVRMGLGVQSPEEWDALMAQQSPDLVGQFANREVLANRYLNVAEILRGQNGGPTKYGLSTQYGVDAEGNPVLIQVGENGQAVRTQMPEGVSLSREPIRIDAGTEWVLLDPITRQPISTIPKNNREAAAETAAGGVEGRAQAEAAIGMPSAIASAERAIANLEAIRDDPALPSITGMIQGRLPPMTQAGANLLPRIEQAQGQAFLEAFESLKGGGQITEIEGKKATEALGRLQRTQDHEEYQRSINDVIEVLRTGMQRARNAAGTQSVAQGQDQQPAVRDFTSMSRAELSQVDVNALSTEELDAYLEATQ